MPYGAGWLRLFSICLLVLGGSVCSAFESGPNEPVSFHREIRPILQRKCQGCHQPAKPRGKLVLTSYAELAKGGETGALFEPGEPDLSVLVEQISGEKPAMPQNAPPLPAAEVDLIKRWIAEGAKDDTPPAERDPIDLEHPPIYNAPPVISAIVYSPDGNRLAVGGYREVLLHKSDGSELLHRLVGLSHRIESLVYSPDGKKLVAVGGAPARFGEVQIWNGETNKLDHSVILGYDVFYGVQFSPDGKLVAFGSADKSARIVEVESAKQRVRIDQHDDWCFGAAFSLDGKYLVTPGRDRHLKLIEVSSGAFIDNITSITPGVLGGALYCVARHPRKDEFLTGGEDGVPKLYQMLRTQARRIGDDANLIRNYEKQLGRISSVAFSKDGKRLAVGAFGGEARVYHTDDGSRVASLPGHQGGIFAIAFHPDGSQIATGGFDGSVRIFDVATGKLVKQFVPVPLQAGVAAAP